MMMKNSHLDVIDDTIASCLNASIDDVMESAKNHGVPISRDTAIVYISQWLAIKWREAINDR